MEERVPLTVGKQWGRLSLGEYRLVSWFNLFLYVSSMSVSNWAKLPPSGRLKEGHVTSDLWTRPRLTTTNVDQGRVSQGTGLYASLTRTNTTACHSTRKDAHLNVHALPAAARSQEGLSSQFVYHIHKSLLASKITSFNRLTASSTSVSLSRLNDALTYAVFLPFGKKTVPGRASTPFSRAFLRMMLSESPSSSSLLVLLGAFRRSLNLGVRQWSTAIMQNAW
jgi:hypothetical protein